VALLTRRILFKSDATSTATLEGGSLALCQCGICHHPVMPHVTVVM